MGRAARVRVHPEFDEDGFLRDPYTWNPEMARHIAAEDGLKPLSDDHWHIIHYMREHFLAHGTLPPMSYVAWVFGMDRDAVDALFHGSREAWRVAGLPNPGEEARAYMH